MRLVSIGADAAEAEGDTSRKSCGYAKEKIEERNETQRRQPREAAAGSDRSDEADHAGRERGLHTGLQRTSGGGAGQSHRGGDTCQPSGQRQAGNGAGDEQEELGKPEVLVADAGYHSRRTWSGAWNRTSSRISRAAGNTTTSRWKIVSMPSRSVLLMRFPRNGTLPEVTASIYSKRKRWRGDQGGAGIPALRRGARTTNGVWCARRGI